MLKMTIGPSRISEEVFQAMAHDPPPIFDPQFLSVCADCVARLRIVTGCRNGRQLIIPGTGTMGLEMLACNFVPKGANVAVISTGYWGARWARICHAVGLKVHLLEAQASDGRTWESLAALLSRTKISAVFGTHVDSSSGIKLDLQALGELAHKHGSLLLIDGICALGIESVEQDTAGVNVYLSATPKGISAPAGLMMISLDRQSEAVLNQRQFPCGSFALDLTPWLDVMAKLEVGLPAYFQSPAGNLIAALKVALERICSEGVHNRIQRHQALREKLHDGFKEIPLRCFNENNSLRANGVTVVRYPERSGPELLSKVAQNGVILAGGLYPGYEELTFRIGHLGEVTRDDIDQTIAALRKSIGIRAA